jgi:hypothetical protein
MKYICVKIESVGKEKSEAFEISKEWVGCDVNGYGRFQIRRTKYSKK